MCGGGVGVCLCVGVVEEEERGVGGSTLGDAVLTYVHQHADVCVCVGILI